MVVIRHIRIIGCFAWERPASDICQFEGTGGRSWRHTLHIEDREAPKNQILLMGGADYRVSVDDNPGLCRYLKSRCYAVRADSALYVNCKKVRYKRFRFGGWYAPATWIQGKFISTHSL